MQFLFCLRNNGLTWREKQRVVINRRVNQRDAACTASMYYQYLALSIFDSIAKISFLRRCLLLAAIWFQPAFNYSNDHKRHSSCKSIYALQRPVPILHNMQGIDPVNQCTLQRPLSIFGSNSKIRSSRRFVSLAAVWGLNGFQLFNECQLQGVVQPWKYSKKWDVKVFEGEGETKYAI